ncbi:protein TIFY 8-like isoform X1 [Canna indica]|uniref:Protein TIFY n=1 Tax=Canna indica TaxID=4628 RepID=A0AAQ3K154_9LILI|nr:protein TIFY 8-like isoform X1 [Canna indica]
MAVVEVVAPVKKNRIMASNMDGKEEEEEEAEEDRCPIFLDFLGTSRRCGGETPPPPATLLSGGNCSAAAASASISLGIASNAQRGLVSATSDLDSERQGVKGSEVFHFHGRKSATPGPEVGNNTLSGRKRSSSESVYSGLMDRGFPVQPNSLESARMIKMFGKEVISEHWGKSHVDDDVMLSMPRPPKVTSRMSSHPPLSNQYDSPISNPELSFSTMHPPRFSQAGSYFDMIPSSSYMCKDTSAVATSVSQSVTDEGSRTSIKTGATSIGNPVAMACERYSIGFLPVSKATQALKSEPSNVVRQSTTASVGRQMTIFYSGQAHVFDNVHPNKADVIMALAGSNSGSWSTTYSPISRERAIANKAKMRTQEEMQMDKSPLSLHEDIVHGLKQIAEIPLATGISGDQHTGTKVGNARPITTEATKPIVEDKRDA